MDACVIFTCKLYPNLQSRVNASKKVKLHGYQQFAIFSVDNFLVHSIIKFI